MKAIMNIKKVKILVAVAIFLTLFKKKLSTKPMSATTLMLI